MTPSRVCSVAFTVVLLLWATWATWAYYKETKRVCEIPPSIKALRPNTATVVYAMVDLIHSMMLETRVIEETPPHPYCVEPSARERFRTKGPGAAHVLAAYQTACEMMLGLH